MAFPGTRAKSKSAVPAAAPSVELSFVFDRETKNTYRFCEVNSIGTPKDATTAIVGTLYVKKSAFGNGNPPAKLAMQFSIA
jgi:hypothetical protein